MQSEAPIPGTEPTAGCRFAPAASLPFDENFGYLMRRIVTLVGNEIERRMEPLGLTDAQWKPLMRLHYTGDATVATLARGCHLDAGAMTRLLDRLEGKGLCRRVRSVEDRRVVNLELTDEGRAAAAQIPAVVEGVQEVVRQGFTADEAARLKDYLQRILHNVQGFGGSEPDGPAVPAPARATAADPPGGTA